jgi:hypothetical protein
MVAIHQTRFFTAGLPSATTWFESLQSCFLFACRILQKTVFVGNQLSWKRTLCKREIFVAFKKLKTGTSAFLPLVNEVDFQRNLS